MVPELGVSSLISVCISLFVILAGLAAFTLIVKKFRSGRFATAAGKWRGAVATVSPINVIATKHLGAQSSLLIVEAEGKRFLLAAGKQGITAIGTLDGTGE
jgi:flagellar biogenesis protein FliO